MVVQPNQEGTHASTCMPVLTCPSGPGAGWFQSVTEVSTQQIPVFQGTSSYLFSHLSFPRQAPFFPFLHIRKLRHKMVKRLTKGHTAQNAGLRLQTLHSFYSTLPLASLRLLLPINLSPNRSSVRASLPGDRCLLRQSWSGYFAYRIPPFKDTDLLLSSDFVESFVRTLHTPRTFKYFVKHLLRTRTFSKKTTRLLSHRRPNIISHTLPIQTSAVVPQTVLSNVCVCVCV